MVLLEIDTEGISSIEFESDAPRSIDMDCVAGWNKASQGMEVKSRQIHLSGCGRDVQTIEANQDAPLHGGVDLSGPPFRPQLGERFLRNVLIQRSVISLLTYVNILLTS